MWDFIELRWMLAVVVHGGVQVQRQVYKQSGARRDGMERWAGSWRESQVLKNLWFLPPEFNGSRFFLSLDFGLLLCLSLSLAHRVLLLSLRWSFRRLYSLYIALRTTVQVDQVWSLEFCMRCVDWGWGRKKCWSIYVFILWKILRSNFFLVMHYNKLNVKFLTALHIIIIMTTWHLSLQIRSIKCLFLVEVVSNGLILLFWTKVCRRTE